MQTDFKTEFVVGVKDRAGAYTTNAVNGTTASSTSSAEAAATRLAEKLLGTAVQSVRRASGHDARYHSAWIITPDPILTAWVWRSGLVEIGAEVPDGAIAAATGPRRALEDVLGVVARHGQGKSEGLLLAPGVPEGDTDKVRLKHLDEWIAWGADGNGKPGRYGVVFIVSKKAELEAPNA